MSATKANSAAPATQGDYLKMMDRQVYTFGMEAMAKLSSSAILISGMSGVGVEIAKNVILSGVREVTIHDTQPATMMDLSSQFYLTPADVGKNRAAACFASLAELNQYVRVDQHTGELTADFLRRYKVVVLVDALQAEVERVSALCRANGVKFIMASAAGLFTRIFVDVGMTHEVTDPDGNPCITAVVTAVSQAREHEGAVATLEDTHHGLETGDMVTFAQVEGMTELNALPPTEIRVTGPSTFVIKADTTNYRPYTQGGYVTQVKMARQVAHEPYQAQTRRPAIAEWDYAHMGRSASLHAGFLGLDAFRARHEGRMPRPHNLVRAAAGVVLGDGSIRGPEPSTRLRVRTVGHRGSPDSPPNFGAHTKAAPLIRECTWLSPDAHRVLAAYFGCYPLWRTGASGFPPEAFRADAAEVSQLARAANDALDPAARVAALDEEAIGLLARVAAGNLSPVASVVGGVVGQEVMKAVTNKYMPLQQWLYLDHSEALPSPLPTEEEAAPEGTRYDGIRAVFGKDHALAIRQLSYFVVGAGAIGCELLKTMAMLGVGTAGPGRIVVTDMDSIEVSNLSRQFLFRPWDVRKMKSTTAGAAVQRLNPEVRIEARLDRVGPDTEDVFGEDFFNSLSGVANALDNLQLDHHLALGQTLWGEGMRARLYMDGRCVAFKKPLLESGTLGTQGNVQVIVPCMTESYGSSRDPPEKSIPLCTLKNFPYLIDHTVEWARSEFEGRFQQDALEANQYLTSPEKALEALRSRAGNKAEMVRLLRQMLVDQRSTTLDECAAWARTEFERCFVSNIRQLLYNFPPDSTTAGGAPFWSGSKRAPTPLVFDPTCREHVDFIEAAALLRARLYGISEEGWDRTRAAQVAANVVVPPFVPSGAAAPSTNDSTDAKALDASASSAAGAGAGAADSLPAEDLTWLEDFLKLPKPAQLGLGPLEALDFEKDDDSNHHIDYITAVANLRAANYQIPQADRRRIKQIAGRIIPAIATTTGLVAGLVGIELIKLHQTPARPKEAFRNWFVNLALPLFQYSEPLGAPKVGDKFTIWDQIAVDLHKHPTLGEVINHLTTTRGLDVSAISCGTALLFMSFWPAPKREMRLSMRVGELYQSISKTELPTGTQSISLEVCASNAAGDDVELPPTPHKDQLSPLTQRLSLLQSRFSSFHSDIETEAQQRRADDEIRVQALREVVTKIEKNLTLEIKRRQEADRTLQGLIEQRVTGLQEALETDLKDKLRQIMTAVESLNTRITQLEHEIRDEKECRQKEVEDTNAILLRQLNQLQNTFEMEKMARLERENQIVKRAGDDCFRLQERMDAEKVGREAALTQLRDDWSENERVRGKADEQFRAHVLGEIAALHNILQTEQQSREQSEAHIVATVDEIAARLQEGLHLVTH
ncbi:putative Ubiquitin-activating enzyme E1 1 [Paratrimastix pyriformis]|uniref:Ubiquitin-activating enzyme E1 1 n=1 Tax=Paratrimastix pyriformis TaxID=342808 RepID=A0ABQ8UDI7_9EUKA|nr:putative Ubiquitin-activating enzyme E1 1 [Paratrimastix pyriformis]